MNGITKASFLSATGPRVRDAMLYDMLEGIHKEVGLKRTVAIALLGGVAAAMFIQSPFLIRTLLLWL